MTQCVSTTAAQTHIRGDHRQKQDTLPIKKDGVLDFILLTVPINSKFFFVLCCTVMATNSLSASYFECDSLGKKKKEKKTHTHKINKVKDDFE